jgi:hypothetical protein
MHKASHVANDAAEGEVCVCVCVCVCGGERAARSPLDGHGVRDCFVILSSSA